MQLYPQMLTPAKTEYTWQQDGSIKTNGQERVTVVRGEPTYATVSMIRDTNHLNVTLRALNDNPADNQVRVGYALSRNVSSATLQILNGSGQVVHSQVLNGGNGSKVTGEVLCNTSSLAAGGYTIKLISSKGNIFDSKTLIIQ